MGTFVKMEMAAVTPFSARFRHVKLAVHSKDSLLNSL